EAAELDVVAGHLGQQCDQHVPPVLDAGLSVRLGRLDVPAGAAEHVDFPTGVEPELEHVQVRAEAERVGQAAAGRRAGRGAAGGLFDGQVHGAARVAGGGDGDAGLADAGVGVRPVGVHLRVEPAG